MNDLNDLFNNAQSEGMSANATGIMVNNLDAFAQLGALGASIDDIDGDETTVYACVLDQTGSMWTLLDNATVAEVADAAQTLGMNISASEVEANDRNNGGRLRRELAQKMVIYSYNEMIKALSASKAADSIVMSTILFNESSDIRHGYLLLSDVPQLDTNSYSPGGMTALHDAILDACTGAVAYSQILRNNGIRTKVVIAVLSDGEDNMSKHSEAHVRTVTDDLVRQEVYTLAFVYFGNNGEGIAKKLGFPNVLTFGTSAHDFRLALGTVSQSVIRASQTVIGSNSSASFFS